MGLGMRNGKINRNRLEKSRGKGSGRETEKEKERDIERDVGRKTGMQKETKWKSK